MARCRATTRKGTRCKNPAREGSEYCGVHGDLRDQGEQRAHDASQEVGPRPWSEELEDVAKLALGVVLAGAVILLAITRRR